jgi:hypothetical protein
MGTMRPPWVGQRRAAFWQLAAPGACSPGALPVALLTATGRGVVPRSPLSSANVRLFLIPRKGEPRLWGHTSGLASSLREQVLPQRGHGLRPPPRRRLAWGSRMAIMAPSGGPLKTADLQGKSRRVRGSVPFGGRNGLVCLSRGEKYCHNGGMAFAPEQAAAGSGSMMAVMAPARGPQEAIYLQGKRLGVHDTRPLGAGMASPAFCLLCLTREVLPQRGMTFADHPRGFPGGPRWRSWPLPAGP